MKKTLIILIGISFLYTAAMNVPFEYIRGSGTVIKTEIEVKKFDGIINDSSFQVYAKPAADHRVIIEADNNLIPYLYIFVNRNNTLILSVSDNVQLKPSSGEIKIYITAPDIHYVEINGTGSYACNTAFPSSETAEFYMKGTGIIEASVSHRSVYTEISGTGDVILNGKAEILSCDVSGTGDFDWKGNTESSAFRINGSGDISAEGSAKNMIIEINGTGDCDLNTYPCEKADVSINGTGDAFITVNRKLNVKINGTGSVYYKDTGVQVRQSIYGTGSLRRTKQ